MHEAGANIVTTIAYVQVIVAIIVWARLRLRWPFVCSFVLAVAETVQYYAGLLGQLWLHIPTGVMIIAAVVVMFASAWIRSGAMAA